MLLTIIIPTINRYSDLRNTLKALQQQEFQDFEILVIDQTDPQAREAIEDEFPIRYFHSTVKSASAARNKGLLEAKGDIILFLDDDVIIDNPGFLDAHLRHYADPERSGVFGAVIPLGGGLRSTRHKWSYWKRNGWIFFPSNFDQEIEVRNGGAGNLSVRRDWAISVGGMDENFQKGAHREESDFCLRYTDQYGLLVHDPNAALVHIGNPSGGIRSWNDVRNLKAQQHFDGAFYFIFRNCKIRDYPIHLLVTFLFFYRRPEIQRSPKMIWLTTRRTWKGIRNALRYNRQGPKYIQVDKSV